jgi:hypothetical protein
LCIALPSTSRTTLSTSRTSSGWRTAWNVVGRLCARTAGSKGRGAERAPLEQYRAVLFYLDNQRLLRIEMVGRFHQAQDRIYRAVLRGGPAAYAVNADGIRRTWP